MAKPEDTKGGINNKVSSGLTGTKLAEQAEENEEMPMHHLIADKDYPSGIREWMITSPSDLKYPTLVVAAAMLSVYLTRVRIQYVYDNQGEKSAIVLQVIVEGEQSSGKSFARYIMRTLMKPFIERDSEMRAKEQEYAALKRRQGKKDGKLPPEPKTDITILPETVSLTMFIKRCDAAVKLYGAPKTLFEFASEIESVRITFRFSMPSNNLIPMLHILSVSRRLITSADFESSAQPLASLRKKRDSPVSSPGRYYLHPTRMQSNDKCWWKSRNANSDFYHYD